MLNILKKNRVSVKHVSGGAKFKIYLSKRPKVFGGGSSTFARLFKKWAISQGHSIVSRISKADLVIVIAHLGEIKDLKKANMRNCCIIHRLDEHFEEAGLLSDKHKKIIELNKYADITVFQSRFVFNNIYPVIKPEKYKIIHNGGDPFLFSPGKVQGSYIGHATWGIGPKKKLDILHNFIITHPEEQFLLIGRHKESRLDFDMPNVKCVGKVRPKNLPDYFQKMKMLYYPSENDPCPNTVIESILCGVPVCYNPKGGTIELVKGQNNNKEQIAGLPIEQVDEMLQNLNIYRANCLNRKDLFFDTVFSSYLDTTTKKN